MIPKNILVIEDNHLVAKSLERLLVQAGYGAGTAESCDEALAALKDADFDLIISDIRMPGIDGVETVKKIREYLNQNQRKAIPEILITGYSEGEGHNNAKKLNTADFLYKPFDKEQFLKSVGNAIGVD